jgi:hypothetical protein
LPVFEEFDGDGVDFLGLARFFVVEEGFELLGSVFGGERGVVELVEKGDKILVSTVVIERQDFAFAVFGDGASDVGHFDGVGSGGVHHVDDAGGEFFESGVDVLDEALQLYFFATELRVFVQHVHFVGMGHFFLDLFS